MHAQTHTHRSRHTCKNIKMNIKTNILMCIHTQLQTHAHRCMSAQAYTHKHVKMSMKMCSCARTHTLHTTQHIHTHTHTHTFLTLHYIARSALLQRWANQLSYRCLHFSDFIHDFLVLCNNVCDNVLHTSLHLTSVWHTCGKSCSHPIVNYHFSCIKHASELQFIPHIFQLLIIILNSCIKHMHQHFIHSFIIFSSW